MNRIYNMKQNMRLYNDIANNYTSSNQICMLVYRVCTSVKDDGVMTWNHSVASMVLSER